MNTDKEQANISTKLDFLKNISISLRASGPSAIIICWFICITLLGLFGDGMLASMAMSSIFVAGLLILSSLAQKVS